jgi:cell cycle checkpoint protein
MRVIEYRSGPGVSFEENKWCDTPWVSEVHELVSFLHSAQTFGGSSLFAAVPANEAGRHGHFSSGTGGEGAGGDGSEAVILVEDVPHIHSSEQRETIVSALRRICVASRSLCVIVHSDSQQSDTSAAMYDWPECIRRLPGVIQIKVNPVAVTFLKKALNRVLECSKLHVDMDTVAAVAASADGDLRSAVNALQMWCAGQRKCLRPSKKSKRKGKDGGADGGAGTGGLACFSRDGGLTAFHSIGKILHNKRLPRPLPSFPRAHEVGDEAGGAWSGVGVPGDGDLRGPLSFEPEKVVAAGALSEHQLLDFLNENYLPFFGDVHDVAAASDALSLSENFMSNWHPGDTGGEHLGRQRKGASGGGRYAVSVSTRALLYENKHPIHPKWNPIFAPRGKEVCWSRS